MEELWTALDHSGKNWRQIFKVRACLPREAPLPATALGMCWPEHDCARPTPARASRVPQALQLLDFLLKNGSTRVIDDARSHVFRVQTLMSFSHYEESVDKGAGSEPHSSPALVRLARNPAEGLG